MIAPKLTGKVENELGRHNKLDMCIFLATTYEKAS